MSGNLYSKGTGGCGCGGGSVSASTCSCGGKDTGPCYTSEFTRPNFFAGQLLTEDDLQQLNEYVVAKNRLHNRFLFGPGVVCGLEVTCDPCGGGGVYVHPGYALDCCGNDLTLACKTPLDIVTMVRELRRTKLGTDCGDPCEEKANGPAASNQRDPAALKYLRGQGEFEPDPKPVLRHYCLYIRYCEEATDPVAPYSTGEPCGASSCETTRVREGVTFELRCQKEEKPPIDVYARIEACQPDLGTIGEQERHLRLTRTLGAQSRTAVAAMRASIVPKYDADHAREMENATRSLTNALTALEREAADAAAAKDKAEATGTETVPVPDAELRNALDAMLNTSSLIARYYASDEADRKMIENDPAAKTSREAAEKALRVAREKFETEGTADAFAQPIEREYARSLLSLTEKLGKAGARDLDMRFLAEGSVTTPSLLNAAGVSLSEIRDWLLSRLEESPNLTDCRLRKDIAEIVIPDIPPGNNNQQLGTGESMVLNDASDMIYDAFRRYLRDCVCAAINPPCSPCDDTSVLLACFEMEDCEVVRICSMERTFVLTPTAVRYWFPQIREFWEEVESYCCSPVSVANGRPTPAGESVPRQDQQPEQLNPAPGSTFAGAPQTKDVATFVKRFMYEPAEPASMHVTKPFAAFAAIGAATTGAVKAPAVVEAPKVIPDLSRLSIDDITAVIKKQVEVSIAEIRKEVATIATASTPGATAAGVTTPRKKKATPSEAAPVKGEEQ